MFSVLQQAPGSERHFFGQEPEFPRPDLAAKLPPAERDRLEQAWLARRDQAAAGGEKHGIGSRLQGEIEDDA